MRQCIALPAAAGVVDNAQTPQPQLTLYTVRHRKQVRGITMATGLGGYQDAINDRPREERRNVPRGRSPAINGKNSVLIRSLLHLYIRPSYLVA